MDITRIAIIDVSGSMAEPFHADFDRAHLTRRSNALVKFEAALEYVRFAVQKMPAGSHLVIIAFAEAATVVFDGAVDDSGGIDRALGILRPDGRETNLGAALTLVLEHISSGEQRIRPIDLVTDGLSNAGDPVSPARILRELYGVYFHLYLIDPTEQGQALASAIVGPHGDGEVDPVSSATALREQQGEALDAESRRLHALEELRAKIVRSHSAFLQRTEHIERPRITAAYPQTILPQEWNSFEVFLYLASLEDLVRKEIATLERRLRRTVGTMGAQFPRSIPRGCRVTVRLSSARLLLNPSELTIRWYGPYYRFPFRFAPRDDISPGTAVTLHVDVAADDLTVAQMSTSLAVVDSDGRTTEGLTPIVSSNATWLEKVFASYARKDGARVRHFKERYEALGVDLFVDVEDLRAGSFWRPELFRTIDECDLLQLLWSRAACESRHVELEWLHALRACEVKGGHFIRPVYWEDPMPPIPPQLAEITFRRATLDAS